MNSGRISYLAILSVVAVLAHATLCEAQPDLAAIDELARLWEASVEPLDQAATLELVEQIEAVVADTQDDRARGSGLLLLGKLHRQAGNEYAALEAYQDIVATVQAVGMKHQARVGQRRAYEQFGRWEEAVSASRLLIEDMLSLVDSGQTHGLAVSVLESEVDWLAAYYERKGHYVAAAELFRHVTDRTEEPRLRWALLREQARLLKRAKMPQEARNAYVEARDALSQVPDLPVNKSFLSKEFEILRGVHGGVISRGYLAESAALVERYRACGLCTLSHEYQMAMETLIGGLRGLSDEERVYAVDLLTSVIERAESARQAGDEVLRRGLLRTAYMTAIDVMVYELRPTDEHALRLLAMFGESLGEEPAVARFIARSVAMLGPHFSEETWDAYPELAELRESDASARSGVPTEVAPVIDEPEEAVAENLPGASPAPIATPEAVVPPTEEPAAPIAADAPADDEKSVPEAAPDQPVEAQTPPVVIKTTAPVPEAPPDEQSAEEEATGDAGVTPGEPQARRAVGWTYAGGMVLVSALIGVVLLRRTKAA